MWSRSWTTLALKTPYYCSTTQYHTGPKDLLLLSAAHDVVVHGQCKLAAKTPITGEHTAASLTPACKVQIVDSK